MQNSRIIDFHVHIFPEKVASKAVAATGNYYGIPMRRAGTVPDLLVSGSAIGCSRYLVHSTATKPEQVSAVNNFIAAEQNEHPEFVGFGTLHPAMSGLPAEVDRMIALGLHGVKLHADFQGFKLDDPAALKLYEAIEGRLPLLLHMGDINTENTTPERLAKIVKLFPNLTVIGAHFGGYSVWDRAERVLPGLGIYVDTSSSLPFLTPEHAARLVRAFSADRCLFGTDYPMWDHAEELARFDKLGLTSAERDMILYANAAKLLGIE